MPISIYQIDAFTNQPFRGNPAAVCILPPESDRTKDDTWMQSVAAEMNLSETAFLVERTDSGLAVVQNTEPNSRSGGYDLRWFTPAVEVNLCGHATLSSSHALWSEGYLDKSETARFYTKSGLLTCARDESGRITMDFPARLIDQVEPPKGMLEALGIKSATFVGRNADDYLVEVESAEIVYHLAPDFGLLAEVETRGTVVTSQATSSDEYDFVSRMFAPAAGVNEDPVTGSAHCALTSYWASKLNKSEMVGYQASPRGGVVQVTLQGKRVLLGGQAVTVFSGELLA